MRFRRGLWRHPDFLRLWAGTTISLVGSGLGAVQFTALLFLDASAREMAGLTAVGVLPGLLGGLAAGAWTDRARRRPILITADLARAALLLSLPAAALFDALAMPQLYAVAFFLGGLGILFDVAYRSYLPALVAKENLIEANSKIAASGSAAEIFAFSLGGWISQLTSALTACAADAVSFLGSAFFVARIRAPEPAPERLEIEGGLAREAFQGFATIRRDARLLGIAASVGGVHLSHGLIGAVILVYANRTLGLAPGVMGLVFAIGGVTSLAGTMATTSMTRRLGAGRALVIASFAGALASLTLPAARGPELAAIAFLTAGQLLSDPFDAVREITRTSVEQAITPDTVRGRVNAGLQLLAMTAQLAGSLAAIAFVPALGIRAILLMATASQLAGAAALALSPVRHEHDLEAARPAPIA
ncbi:MAG: MFS transporter [Dehalococcoidia bacterium]|nr:MFS transporter [Dehalococcoidia bacterium]